MSSSSKKTALIRDILFWILFILGIIVFLWALFGNSPTLEQTLLIFILGMVIKNEFSINKVNIKTELTKQKLENLTYEAKNKKQKVFVVGDLEYLSASALYWGEEEFGFKACVIGVICIKIHVLII